MRTLPLLPTLVGALLLAGCTAEGRHWPGTVSVEQEGSSASSVSSLTAAEARRALREARRSTQSPAPEIPDATPPPPVSRASFTIPILVYHHIRDPSPWHPSTWSWKMSVSPAAFERQMRWLTERGYTSIDMDTLTRIFKGEEYGPEKPVVITFDDNQMSAYEHGVPLMEKHGHIGVFYLVTNYFNNASFIGSDLARDLHVRGMDVQSHTLSHATLTNLSLAALDHELAESRRILEELLGKSVLHIAYPSTAHNQRVRDRTHAAGYETGVIMDPRPMTESSDPYRLPRIMMTETTDMERVLP